MIKTGKGIPVLILLALVLAAGVRTANAMTRLDSPSSVLNSGFGLSVGISGNNAIVGACRDSSDDNVRSGAAYIYRREYGQWRMAAKLTPPDGMENDFFGHSVAISGDWAIVGAPNHYSTAYSGGTAYLYEYRLDEWRFYKKLTPSDLGRNNAFGYAVSISGDIAVAGAYRAGNRGAVYIFWKNNGWNQTERLIASNGSSGDDFGRSVAVSGDWVAVGSIHQQVNGVRSGAVHFYQVDGNRRVIREAMLIPDQGEKNDFFGFSVSISSDWALVGASADDDRGKDAGAAYLFQYNGTDWIQKEKLLPNSGSGLFFGRSAAISGDFAIVGADGTDKWGADSGAAYLYERNVGWEQTARLTPDGGRSNDRFGWSVAVDDSFLIGARNRTPGAAYIESPSSDKPRIEIFPPDLTIRQVAPQQTQQGERAVPDKASRMATARASGLEVPEDVEQYWANRPIPPSKPIAGTLPSAVDWKRFDSPVKNQGSCGACWAFAAVALVENLTKQEGIDGTDDLSEQAVLACANGGCRGGWYFDGLSYIRQNGLPSEGCLPYNGDENNCTELCDKPNFLVKIQGHTPSMGLWGKDQSAEDLKLALQNGPLIVYMKVPDNGTFEGTGYKGGVYDYQGGPISATQGHAVLVVGYNDLQKYFLVKNSWGDWWGENGYFRISYDDVEDDVQFGAYAATASGAYMEGSGSFVTIANSGKADLEISRIESSRGWLNFSPASFSPIPPGAQKSLNIFVTNWDVLQNLQGEGEIRIHSNDSERSVVSIPVTAVPMPGDIENNDPDKGDVNNDDAVDLTDAIIALKILSGIQVRIPLDLRSDYEAADVNGNKKVDLSEVLYILDRAAR